MQLQSVSPRSFDPSRSGVSSLMGGGHGGSPVNHSPDHATREGSGMTRSKADDYRIHVTSTMREVATRRGEDLGIGLGDFDILDTLG